MILLHEKSSRADFLMNNTLDLVRNTANVIRESSNRRQILASMFDDICEVYKQPSLCPTRWYVLGTAIRTIVKNYKEVKQTLNQLANDTSVRQSSQGLIQELSTKLDKAKIFATLYFSEKNFLALSQLLQRPDITPRES